MGIAKNEFRQKKSKALDMHLYWINNRIEQRQFRVFWRPGPENMRDYHSKHHPPEHHIAVQSKYLHVPKLTSLQEYVNLTVIVNPTKTIEPASANVAVVPRVRILTVTVN